MSETNPETNPATAPLIRHIGVCLDRSALADRVVPHAIAMARAFGADVTLLHALETPHETAEATPTDPLEWELQRTHARRHLSTLEAEHAAGGLEVRSEILEGRPAEEIRDWARRHEIDLLVLGSHGESGWTEWSLASTARKLIEGTPGSVLLVPAWSVQEPVKHDVTYSRVLVLLDGSRRAESALPAALGVARTHGSDVILLHVVPHPERSCPCPLDEEEHELERRLIDRNTRAAQVYLEGIRKHMASEGIQVRALVTVDGDVRSEILRRVAADHVDLLVFSGHGSGGRAELPFGSVAGFLLEHATVPLLVIRDRTAQATRSHGRTHSRRRARLPQLASS
ncbi:MAG TPA: universal stress protein [Deltaproteobacteria bacterium]|nr:universal stress protein [Deltaproteobacteria bacterium]